MSSAARPRQPFRSTDTLTLVILAGAIAASTTFFAVGADSSVIKAGIWLQPIAYALCHLLFIAPALKTGHYRITLLSFTALASLRLIVLPCLLSITRAKVTFLSLNPSFNSIHAANVLTIYEVFVASMFLAFLTTGDKFQKRQRNSQQDCPPFLRGSRFAYVLYFALAAAIALYTSRSVQLFQFGVIDATTNDRLGDITDTRLVLARQVIRIAILFLFALCVNFWGQRYRLTGRGRYVTFSLLLAMLNVALIVGERRSEQVYTAFVVTTVLYFVFPTLRRRVVTTMLLTALLVVGMMTIYKHFYAFLYGSYWEAVTQTDVSATGVFDALQASFYGPGNIAATVEFAQDSASSTYSWIFDMARSTFGPSFLLRDSGTLTSEGFNTFIYGYERPTGQLISSVGYGYIFFGPLLAPLVICFNIFVATRLERWLLSTRYLEVQIVAGYILARFAFGLFSLPPPLVSAGSIMLATGGLLYLVAKLTELSPHISDHSNPTDRSYR